jgi:N-acetylneuraminate synthase
MVRVVAEIGCNHMGDMDVAREMITVAARTCGVDVVKLQKRHARELLSPEQYAAPHPVPANAFGDSYGAHREALELTTAQHAELMEHGRREGVAVASSVWDLTSAREIAALNPGLIKVPSAGNLHWEMQDWLCANYAGEIHVSTGMTTRDEVEAVVAFYEARGRAGDLVLYACTSGYPVPFEDVCLLEIAELERRYGGRVKAIGFSGHHLGIAADVAALALGAEWIERHFTLDRTWKGTDHAASLEPDGLRRLVRDLRNVERALTLKPAGGLAIERVQRDKLKWSPQADRAPAAARG